VCTTTVSNITNSSKADKPIEEWQPPNATYVCTYAQMWVAIKYQYQIPVDDTILFNGMSEYSWLNARL
jgi:hypothetical protein